MNNQLVIQSIKIGNHHLAHVDGTRLQILELYHLQDRPYLSLFRIVCLYVLTSGKCMGRDIDDAVNQLQTLSSLEELCDWMEGSRWFQPPEPNSVVNQSFAKQLREALVFWEILKFTRNPLGGVSKEPFLDDLRWYVGYLQDEISICLKTLNVSLRERQESIESTDISRLTIKSARYQQAQARLLIFQMLLEVVESCFGILFPVAQE